MENPYTAKARTRNHKIMHSVQEFSISFPMRLAIKFSLKYAKQPTKVKDN